MITEELLNKLIILGRWILVILICILIALVIGISKLYSTDNVSNTSTNNEETYNTNYDVSMFKEIEAKDIKTETKKTKQVIYVGRETCGWCAAFLPMLWKAQEKYDYQTLYIDIAKIIDFNTNSIKDQDAYDIMMELNGEDYEGYMSENFGATPMILVVENGEIISAQTGYSEYDYFEKILEQAGY